MTLPRLLTASVVAWLGTCAAVRLCHPRGYVACSRAFTERVYVLVGVLDSLFRERDLVYWVEAGTLLGAVRHGGLIPWDGDVDLAIPESEAPRLEALGPELAEHGLELRPTSFGSKVGFRDDPFPHRTPRTRALRWLLRNDHPYVDIFYKTELPDRYVFARPYPQRLWPEQSVMLREELFPLARRAFGPLQVNSPARPEPYLERAYGDWRRPRYSLTYNAPGFYRTFGLFLQT